MTADVVVIGGGPAGSSAAIRLVVAGMKVRLFEKARFPRPKLCGGYLSAEAIPELAELGLLESVQSSGAWPIHRVLVSAPSGRSAVSELSHPAFSISRHCLDAILLNHARNCGVDVVEGEDGLPYLSKNSWTVIATGRALTLTLSRVHAGEGRAERWVRAKSFFGIQAFFENVSGIRDQIELDMIPGGYFGLALQEEGLVNVCGLLDQSAMRQAGSDLDQAVRKFASGNPLLQNRLKNARRMSAWQAVGPVRMGLRKLTEEGTFYVGDAACVVDPFAGEGLAMGLVTGRILRNAFEEAPDHPAEAYERLWHNQFDRSRRLQTSICWAIEKTWWQEFLAMSCQSFPALMRWLTDNTRPYADLKPDTNFRTV